MNRLLYRANGYAALAWIPAREANIMRELWRMEDRIDWLAQRAAWRASGIDASLAIRATTKSK